MKKLLLLGGISYLIPVIKKAKALGHYVITCDYLPENIAHKYSDEYHNVSIIDKDAVLNLAKELQIDGIMSFAVDPGVITAAYVAEKMGLPSPGPYESVKILQDKGLFRAFLQNHDFNCPKYKSYTSPKLAVEEFDEADLPVIVKPVDSAGSKGVTKVVRKEDLRKAVDYALQLSPSKTFIIEEFLELKGYQSGADSFAVDGEFKFISFDNQRFDKNSPNPYTPAAHTWPSSISQEKQSYLANELQRLIHLLKMKSSIYNIEVREATNGKVYIMEVSPRGGGNRLAEIIEYATGVDLISNGIKASLGEELDEIPPASYNRYWILKILYSNKTGVFEKVEINPTINDNVYEIELRVKSGDKVESFLGAQNAIGTIVLNFNDQKQMDEVMGNIIEYVKVIVK